MFYKVTTINIREYILILCQVKAKTELLLSAEAAKAAQRADLQNHLDTAQNALQDKQQVREIVKTYIMASQLRKIYLNQCESYVSSKICNFVMLVLYLSQIAQVIHLKYIISK